MSRPLVVALVPAWNAEAFIADTLRSLACQTYPNLRVIISDDASTDLTASICERFAASDPRFVVIRQPRNLGWVGNTNALLAQRTGAAYQLFALHDDELESNYIERLVERLEANPHAVLAFADMLELKEDGSRALRVFDELDGMTEPLGRGLEFLRNQWFWWTPFRGVFRSAAAERIGGLRRSWAGDFGADYPWLLALALLGEFERVAQPLCRKRLHNASLSARWTYSFWAYTGVGWSCVAEIRRSGFDRGSRLALYRQLVGGLYRLWFLMLPKSALTVRITALFGVVRSSKVA